MFLIALNPVIAMKVPISKSCVHLARLRPLLNLLDFILKFKLQPLF